MRPEYLFIRILEACNAGCSMCGYAFSRDGHRFSAKDLAVFLPRLKEEGIRFIRFTGGEPLMHDEILDLIRISQEHGIASSIITNGGLLARKPPRAAGSSAPTFMEALAEAGLSQLIVSLDGARAETHDRIRASPGLFDRAINGLRLAARTGVLMRVNTVCGPENFREMPALQELLTELGVKQWELSSLKLERKLDYSEQDRHDIEPVIDYVYRQAAAAGRLVPMGKIWCGNTSEERERYFALGVTPRADNQCLLVDKVRYLDSKNGRLYSCSLIPHRPDSPTYAAAAGTPESFSVVSPAILRQAEQFKREGPQVCTGCSTTAAGFSNHLLAGHPSGQWSY